MNTFMALVMLLVCGIHAVLSVDGNESSANLSGNRYQFGIMLLALAVILIGRRLYRFTCTPTVETLEAIYTAIIGERVELKCSVAATPWITSVSWQHILPGGRSVQLSIDQRKYKGSKPYDPHLIINELTKNDEGEYVCTVSNLCGKDQSAPTKLNVKGGTPTVETLEANYTALIGERVELKCSVAAIPWITSVSWQHILPGGRSVQLSIDQRKYKGSKPYDPHLVINELTKDDEGGYVCTVSNLCGKDQSAPTKLNVKGGTPTVETLEANYTALIGERVELKCSVAAIPWITSVSWQHILPGGRSVQLSIDQRKYKGSNPYDPHLVINELTKDDEGGYVCTVSNVCEEGQSAPTKLNVNEDMPSVRIHKNSYTAEIGHRVKLKCSVTAFPCITSVSWQRVGHIEQLDRSLDKYGGSNSSDPSLVINDIKKDDEGEYTCTVSSCRKTWSASTNLTVNGGPPVLNMNPNSLSKTEGDVAVLKCNVIAKPTATVVKWSKGGEFIAIDNDKYIGGAVTCPSLVITNAEKGYDEGVYTCVAENTEGQGKKEVNLTIQNRKEESEKSQIEEPIPDTATKELTVNRHGQMVNDLSDIICPEEKDQWAKFTQLLKAYVPTRELSKSFHEIIGYLIRQEKIRYGHYDKLSDVVYKTHKNDLHIIREAEADIKVLKRGVTSEEPVVIECVYDGEYKSELINEWMSQIEEILPKIKCTSRGSGRSGSIVLTLTISGAETPHELSALYLAEKVKVYLQKERIVLKDESGEPLKLQTTPKVMIPTKETPTVRFSKGYYQFAEGETAIVRCAMVPNSEVECIEWFRVKDGTHHAIRINNEKYFGGPKSSSLGISNLNEDDRGMYICRTSNGASKAESDIAYIEVQSSGEMETSMGKYPDLEKTREYVYSEHGSSLQKAFYTAWTNKDYPDITLRVGKDSILTHRLILTSLSEYFKTLLHMVVNGIKDEAELHEVEFDSLCQILKFGYTGKIKISMENVPALFIASSYLQVVFVKESCERYLLDNLDKSNCIRTWCLADQYNAMTLNKKAVLMFMLEFENISSTEDFVTLVTMKMFLGVLEQEGLVVSRDGVILPPAEQEVSLLGGVLHYIDRTKCGTEHAVSLLKVVRLPLIEHAMITERMSKYPKLCQNNAVKNIVDAAKTFQESSEPPQQTSSIWLAPRRPKINGYMYDPQTYAVGGQDGVHFFLRSHFGLPRPSKEALITSVDVHLRFWTQHPQENPVVGGLTFRYSDNTVTQGGLAADSPCCTNVESFTLQDCEYITKVVIKSGWMMDSIKFETNFGKSYGPWGGEGGGERICVAPNGAVGYLHSFAGIDINSGGWSAVHRVRLGWATLDDTEQELEMRDLYGELKVRSRSDEDNELYDEDEVYVEDEVTEETDSDEYVNLSDNE